MKIFRAVQYGMEIPENLDELVLPVEEEKKETPEEPAVIETENLNYHKG